MSMYRDRDRGIIFPPKDYVMHMGSGSYDSSDMYRYKEPELHIDVSRSVDDNLYGNKHLMEIFKGIDRGDFPDCDGYNRSEIKYKLKINPIQERVLICDAGDRIINPRDGDFMAIHMYGRRIEVEVDKDWLIHGGAEEHQKVTTIIREKINEELENSNRKRIQDSTPSS